jgi:hypothetical protein
MTADGIKTAPHHPSPATNATAMRGGCCFRWRVIPATLLYLYGATLLMCGVMGVGTVLVTAVFSARGTPLDSGPAGERFMFIVSPGMVVLGWLFLYMGRRLWQGRWRRVAIAVLPAAAMIGLGILVGRLIGIFK